MSFDPAAALVRYHAALDSQDLEGVARLLAADARYVSAGIGEVKGREAILAAMRAYFAKSEDHQAFDDEVTVLGPRQARSLWRLCATNRVTGAVVERHGTEVVDFDAEGLVIAVLVTDAD